MDVDEMTMDGTSGSFGLDWMYLLIFYDFNIGDQSVVYVRLLTD